MGKINKRKLRAAYWDEQRERAGDEPLAFTSR